MEWTRAVYKRRSVEDIDARRINTMIYIDGAIHGFGAMTLGFDFVIGGYEVRASNTRSMPCRRFSQLTLQFQAWRLLLYRLLDAYAITSFRVPKR